MTWGKGGSTNVVHVTTTSRRALSVPIESYQYIPVVTSKTARTVYAHKENGYDLTRASRRSDQKLLNDIQTRLANAPFTQPMRESRSRSRRTTSSRRGSVSSVHSVPSRSRRQSLADEDFELVFPEKLTTKNLPPCARRAFNRGVHEPRSTSVPPTPSSMRSSTLSSQAFQSSGGGFIDLGSPLFRIVGGGPHVKPSYMSSYARNVEAIRPLKLPNTDDQVRNYSVPLAKRRYSFAFEDPDDFFSHTGYTPQLRTAQSYALTVPKPYVRRHVPLIVPPRHDAYVYRGEGFYVPTYISSGFRATSEPRRVIQPTASLAIHQARTSLNRIERELGMGAVSLDDAPAFEEPVVHASCVMPVTSYRTGFMRDTVPARRPSYTYGVIDSRPPMAPKPSRLHEIEARLEMMIVPDLTPPVSYAALRSRASEARRMMDQHKVLLDRYLPVPTGIPNDVSYEVEYKFNELADRMPQLRPRERSRATSLPPICPVVSHTSRTASATSRTSLNDYSNAVRSSPFRPTMSDTRKRAREVLCRTKRDPHYFDY